MTTPTGVDAVLWDIDGTLAESEPVHLRADALAVARLGGRRPGPEIHALLLGLTMREAHQVFVEDYGLEATYDELCATKYLMYGELAGEIHPRAGPYGVYQAALRAGIPQALVSNADRLVVDVNTRAIGLSRPDLVTVSRNDVREGKPAPEPYLRAAWLLRAEPSRCVVVEDSPAGALAGVAAGMRVVCWPDPTTGLTLEFPHGARIVHGADALAGEIGVPLALR